MKFASAVGEQRYADVVAAAPRLIVGLDFDGTLAPIVDDPTQARIHPGAAEALVTLAEKVCAVAVITGRPARQVVALGGLEEVGEALAAAGKELYVFGQYGNERWSSAHRTIRRPLPPPGLAGFHRELPQLLRHCDAEGAFVEEKGIAIAIHTRRLADPEGVFERLLVPVADLAASHDLIVEPGRAVIEVRAPGVDKGTVVANLVAEMDAGGFVFAGDDLGDLEAFEEVAALGKAGLATLLVCSANAEQSVLEPLADIVVRGPEGVVALLRQLTADIIVRADDLSEPRR